VDFVAQWIAQWICRAVDFVAHRMLSRSGFVTHRMLSRRGCSSRSGFSCAQATGRTAQMTGLVVNFKINF
jgi:hypothetical protein